MGSDQGSVDERPAHKVKLSPFGFAQLSGTNKG